MCLSTIREEYDSPSTVVIDGWKTFGGTDAKPQFESLELNGKKDVPLDQWIVAEEKTISMNTTQSYKSGFHVYIDDKQVESDKKKSYYSKYRRVYVRKVAILGVQDSMDVVIAKEMYVPSNPKAWPPHPSFPEPPSMLAKIKSKLPGGNA